MGAHHPDDFYKAFAIAMLQWQSVEHSLFHLFYRLSDASDIESAGTEYYRRKNFGPKFELVKEYAKSLPEEATVRWHSIKEELARLSDYRNALAHLTAAVDFKEDDSLELVLAPAVFLPKALIKERKKLDAEGCEQLACEFGNLARNIQELVGFLDE
ncbi:hypothetical protein [Noviherbaspirillum sp. UKPF54]|uniref:hypothetical protein n=1 Tax=Noviherbaspirillum sp. UKPF54 TaxID=2601898 RepID=UPI0011B13821|nr:hypothetical protein [Noviherbaspirillum sp. UKPF54]QDZ26769.1 hypothetical protein FAY22_01535 [Noviherbaspirillum sp. UKPF54]